LVSPGLPRLSCPLLTPSLFTIPRCYIPLLLHVFYFFDCNYLELSFIHVLTREFHQVMFGRKPVFRWFLFLRSPSLFPLDGLFIGIPVISPKTLFTPPSPRFCPKKQLPSSPLLFNLPPLPFQLGRPSLHSFKTSLNCPTFVCLPKDFEDGPGFLPKVRRHSGKITLASIEVHLSAKLLLQNSFPPPPPSVPSVKFFLFFLDRLQRAN